MKPIWGILMDAFFVALLLWCSYTDLKSRTVSNLSVAMLLCLGLVHMVLVVLSGSTWWVYPTGMLLGIPFLIAWLKGGIGGGDVKLIIAIGLYLGLWNMVYAFVMMVPILFFLFIWSSAKHKKGKHPIPFGPILACGAIETLILTIN